MVETDQLIKEGMTLLELAQAAKEAGLSQEQVAKKCSRDWRLETGMLLRFALCGFPDLFENLIKTGGEGCQAARLGIRAEWKITFLVWKEEE